MAIDTCLGLSVVGSSGRSSAMIQVYHCCWVMSRIMLHGLFVYPEALRELTNSYWCDIMLYYEMYKMW